jgi:hypothetical protein
LLYLGFADPKDCSCLGVGDFRAAIHDTLWFSSSSEYNSETKRDRLMRIHTSFATGRMHPHRFRKRFLRTKCRRLRPARQALQLSFVERTYFLGAERKFISC